MTRMLKPATTRPITPSVETKNRPVTTAEAGRSRVDRLRFSKVAINAEGRSNPVSFVVPADAVSVVALLKGTNNVWYGFSDLRNPRGERMISSASTDRGADFWDGPFNSPNRVLPPATEGCATLQIPGSDAVALVPGRWSLIVRAANPEQRPESVDVQIFVQRAPELRDRGSVQLHFHLTGTHGWTAATAGNDPDFQAMLAATREKLRSGGIELGATFFEDAPREHRNVEISAKGLGRMLSSTKQPDRIHVFLVDRLAYGDEAPGERGPSGVSGGIPGAPIPGTPASGLAVAIDGNPTSMQRHGVTLAHELGHFLGLSHTEDYLGQDQFVDTAAGPAGHGNVMFPAGANFSVSFSPSQRKLMLRHPLVQSLSEASEEGKAAPQPRMQRAR